MTKRIDVAEVIDRATIRGVHIQVLAIGLLVSLVDGFDNQALAFVAPAMSRDWGRARLRRRSRAVWSV